MCASCLLLFALFAELSSFFPNPVQFFRNEFLRLSCSAPELLAPSSEGRYVSVNLDW